jgi:hypothetical protein
MKKPHRQKEVQATSTEADTLSLSEEETNRHTNGNASPKEPTEKLSNREILRLFEEYDRLTVPIEEAVRLANQAKSDRSEIVERIAKGTAGRKKSWKLPDGRVFTLMYRDDKTGKRWFYFRTPGEPDTLNLAEDDDMGQASP